ncbi:MAG TPA: hypothetical protein PKL97_06655 [Candidatus Omnitrophota bacterium]|nr:hypothetical protein [Candidatus Omnitrophota bacterium]
MKRFWAIILVLGFAGSLWGCATFPDAGPDLNPETENPLILADGLLGHIFDIYRNYNRAAFEDEISQDFSPVRSAFISRSEEGFYSGVPLEIHYFIDQAILKNGRLAVNFKWEKRVAIYASRSINMIRQQSQFVFQKEGNQWRLYQAKGANPFV